MAVLQAADAMTNCERSDNTRPRDQVEAPQRGVPLVAAAARAIEPFAHGIWLTAYLFLVGFLAQLLLRRGQAMVLGASPADANAPPISAQAILWNAGVVAVPLGVLVARAGETRRSVRNTGPDGRSAISRESR
jgi:hypothetical protein